MKAFFLMKPKMYRKIWQSDFAGFKANFSNLYNIYKAVYTTSSPYVLYQLSFHYSIDRTLLNLHC